MRRSTRKLVGIMALLVLFFVWGFCALAAAWFTLESPDAMVRWAFYIIAGTGWVVFAVPIVSFMSRR